MFRHWHEPDYGRGFRNATGSSESASWPSPLVCPSISLLQYENCASVVYTLGSGGTITLGPTIRINGQDMRLFGLFAKGSASGCGSARGLTLDMSG